MNIPLKMRNYVERDLNDVHALVVETVRTSYPAYYPARAVEFFIKHHSPEKIVRDGVSAFVVVAFAGKQMVGTGTLAHGEIARVFVLPELQGHGIGKAIMDRLEAQAVRSGLSRVILDASLPAFQFYLARGFYKCSDKSIDVGEKQKLRYYRMAKNLTRINRGDMKASEQTKKPLSGTRIIVGRAKAQAGALAKLLRGQGANVTAIPFIEIRQPKSFKPLDTALREILEYDWLILTSVNGVDALFERMKKLKLEVGWIAHMRIAAIGPATKEAIEKHGLDVHVVPKEYVAESVVKALKKRVEGRRVLLVRAKVARDVIPNELRKAGAAVDVVEAYETVLPKASRAGLMKALKDGKRRPEVITFTSSSTARNFVELIGQKAAYSGMLDGVKLASIGPVTTATLKELGLKADIRAKEYTIPGLVEAITRNFTS